MSLDFENGMEQLSSSASSSFASEEPMSDPRLGAGAAGGGGGAQRSPELSTNTPKSTSTPTAATTGGPGGPNNLNVNKVARPRPGMAEKPYGGSPSSRMAGRFVDPKDENGYAAYTRRTNSATTGVAHQTSPNRAFPSPLNGGGGVVRTTAAAAASSNNGADASSPAVGEFAKRLSESYFKCAVCAKVAADPVMISPQSSLMCRRCCVSLPGATSVELPKTLREAMREVKVAGGMPDDEDSGAIEDRRTVRVKRPIGAGATGGGTNGRNANEGTLGRESAEFAAAVAVTQAVLRELTEAELAERQQIGTAETVGRDELAARKVAAPAASSSSSPAAAAAAARAPAGGADPSPKPEGLTSKQCKLEADLKYEKAQYTAAVELYSKALALQPVDKLSNPKFLYGNRSAAYYMAQRYNDCINDCLEVVRLEPKNTKMLSRAARAACTMGDLQRSVDILQSISKEQRSEENETDLTRYKASLETYRHAERCFGTPEGDQQYRMLVAQYSDAVPFRIRSAESLMKQKHYMRAVEVLETLSYSTRTPTACRIMSECLYLSGFEHFERARKCVLDASQLDDACAALLKKIEAVDDGKQKGNMSFNKKSYGPAAEFYTAAITAAADNEQVLRVLYCNRAAAYKELGRYREGVEDCTKTLNIDSDFFKAYARRARCHEHLGDHFAAVRDYKKAIEYDTTDRELARELRGAEQNLAKETEREKDFYFQLGVTRSATERDIKLKYRELSLRWHPDKCVNMDDVERERAEHKFKIISEAHATLVDPAKRREYDMKQDREKFTRPGGFGFASTYSGSSNEYFRGRHRAGTNGFW